MQAWNVAGDHVSRALHRIERRQTVLVAGIWTGVVVLGLLVGFEVHRLLRCPAHGVGSGAPVPGEAGEEGFEHRVQTRTPN